MRIFNFIALIRTINDQDVNAELDVDVKNLDRGLKEYTYRMKIPSSDVSNAGKVKLKVKNQYGTAESDVKIVFQICHLHNNVDASIYVYVRGRNFSKYLALYRLG